MRVYVYLDKISQDMLNLIYKVVMDNCKYARKIHRGDWEKAVELAIMHIAKNFDMEKSKTDDLEDALNRYTKTTLKWISENSSDELDLSSDFSTVYEPFIADDKDVFSDLVVKLADRGVVDCIKALVFPCVVNMEYLMTGKGKLKMEKVFLDLRSLYSYSVLEKCTKYLKSKYGKEILDFKNFLRITATCKEFSKDRLDKCIDSTLTYVGSNNGIVIVTRKENTHAKYLYIVEYGDVIPQFINTVYKEKNVGYIEVEGIKIYSSLSGKLFDNLVDLKREVEVELVNEVVIKRGLSVFTYSKGRYIYFSSTRDIVEDLDVNVFGKVFTVKFKSVALIEHII